MNVYDNILSFCFTRYLLDYKELFGGAVGITQDQFIAVNGFSNEFYGWGGEDDDFFRRLKDKGLGVIRLSPVISSYRMLPHHVRNVHLCHNLQ